MMVPKIGRLEIEYKDSFVKAKYLVDGDEPMEAEAPTEVEALRKLVRELGRECLETREAWLELTLESLEARGIFQSKDSKPLP